MKYLSKRKTIFTILFFLLIPIFFFVAPVDAQTLGNSSLSIGFAPIAQFLSLNPGEKYKGEVTVWNLSPSSSVYNIIVRGFKQIENYPGTARIHTPEEEERDVFSAASWISVPHERLNLISNQYYKIPFEIRVPQDNASGEFHAMIFLLSESAKADLGPNSISFSNLGAGPALFINVGKEIFEKAEIEYFKTDRKFYEKLPVSFITRYLNKGNTHITPAGDIVVYNFLGQEVDRIYFNENKQSLLRGNGANYTDEWEKDGIFFINGKLAIGPIKAQLVTTYLSTNPGYAPLSAQTSFWILPWKIILAILVFMGIMYRVIFRKRKKNEKKTAPDPIYLNYPKYR